MRQKCEGQVCEGQECECDCSANGQNSEVIDETDFAEANTLFGHLGVKVVTSHRLLGGHIGLSKGLQEYVDEKVARWKDYVARTASVAPSQPQDAYVALTKSLACEWDYLQRVVPECGPAFEPVEESLRETFLPSLFGTEISETERRLFQLPVKFSGLGIRDPTLTSVTNPPKIRNSHQ